ncbi:MAG: glycosyltransferase family 2 protein [Candidatus Hodarchaeota archaeon]
MGPFGEPVIPYRKREPLFISGVNNFFKKSTLLKIGGFDPIIKYGGPDLELGIRARLFGAKVLGDLSNIVDHTSRPVDAHFRSPKNRENLIYFLVSRVSYSYLKNFEWRYGINLSLRYTIYHFYESLRALRNEDVKIMKGFLRGIFWILINFGKIIINHYRVKRNVKGSKLIKKFFHPELFSIKRLTKPKPSPFSRKLY